MYILWHQHNQIEYVEVKPRSTWHQNAMVSKKTVRKSQGTHWDATQCVSDFVLILVRAFKRSHGTNWDATIATKRVRLCANCSSALVQLDTNKLHTVGYFVRKAALVPFALSTTVLFTHSW